MGRKGVEFPKLHLMEPITSIDQLDMNATYTYADYLQWRLDEYVELFRGKIARMSPARMREHQRMALRISSRLEQYLRKKTCQVYIAPFDVRLPKKDVSLIKQFIPLYSQIYVSFATLPN